MGFRDIITALTTLDDSRYVFPQWKEGISVKTSPLAHLKATLSSKLSSSLEQEIISRVDNVKSKSEEESILDDGEGNSVLELEIPPSRKASVQVDYSFHHDRLFAEQAYGAPAVDYAALWYGADTTERATFQLKDEYWATSVPVGDTETEMLTTEEAQETFVDIQYSAAVGAASEVNSGERRKFDLWIKFNSAFFKLFESMYAVTREVDYRPLA